MRIAAHGLAIDPPGGWDARIVRPPPDILGAAATGGPPPTVHPVLHAANFALPEERGDFGSGAVELMGPFNVLVALVEYHPDESATALFAPRGMPRRLEPGSFSPDVLQRTIPGQAGSQHFFSENGRAFSLYVVLGSFAQRAALVGQVNGALERVEIGAA